MKKFLKHVFAVFVGLLLFSVVATAIAIVGIVGMIASAGSSATAAVKDGSVLVLKLEELSGERSADVTPQDYLQGNTDGTIGLAETMAALRKAKTDNKIKGIYIEAGGCGLNLAQSQELREGLADFKKSGKWVVAYGDAYHAGDYYISTVADKVYLNPQGMIRWRGLGGVVPMMKNFYAKLGIKQIAFKCGKYKSATEIYTEDHLSAPARQQEERIVGVAWKNICEAVSKSRGISVDSLNSYADRMADLDDQKTLVSRRMVDGLLYYDQISTEIKKRLNIGADDDIPQVTVSDFQGDDSGDGGKVAVYYASGEIVDEAPQQFMANAECIVGNEMVEDLNELADDDDVKAVVLRINSPGGSSYASEQIWRAIEMLKKKKPVVVSMSDVAASGGYYISCGANYIFADPMTETGSIGVYGIYSDGSGLLNDKLGLNYEVIKSNRNSAEGANASLFMGLLAVGIEPLTPEQVQREQAAVDNVYHLFKSRVAQGRNLSMSRVEEIAQGHVYIGSDALRLKLIDELGGLGKAEAKAALLAKLDKYQTVVYPEPKSFIETLMDDSDNNDNHLNAQMKVLLGAYYKPLMMLNKIGCMGRRQALMPYEMQIRF